MSKQQLGPVSLIVCTLTAVLFLFTGKGTESLTAKASPAAKAEGVSAPLQESPAGTSSCHVGPPYQSYTGTDAIPNPTVPPLIGLAGSKIYETEFPVQNQIVRVTDENTAALLHTSTGAFTVVGAALTNRWSADDTHFVVLHGSTGQYFIYNFDPKCSDATYMNAVPDNFNNHSAVPPFSNAVFNAVAVPPIVYGVAGNQFQSCTHNHSIGTCPASLVFDVSAHPSIPPFFVTGLGGLSATKDQDSNIALAATVNFRPEPPGCKVNCTGQDVWDGVVVCVRNYDGLGHGGCVYWDSFLGNLGGDFGPQCTACLGLPQGMLLHDGKINAREDGLLTDLWVEGTAPLADTLHGNQFWNVGTGTFVQFTVAPAGHGVMGNTFYANQSNGYNKDARSWLTRPFSLITPTELIPNPPKPVLGTQDGHPGLANNLKYLYQNMYQPLGGNCLENTAWACEDLAIQLSAPPLGRNATVWRFIHNWSFADEKGFDRVPHGEVSPDGKFMCINSDWGGTLLAGRGDVFCHEMK